MTLAPRTSVTVPVGNEVKLGHGAVLVVRQRKCVKIRLLQELCNSLGGRDLSRCH